VVDLVVEVEEGEAHTVMKSIGRSGSSVNLEKKKKKKK
jgi:hypothetical protein